MAWVTEEPGAPMDPVKAPRWSWETVTDKQISDFVPASESELRLIHEVVCAAISGEVHADFAFAKGVKHVILMRRMRERLLKEPYRSPPPLPLSED